MDLKKAIQFLSDQTHVGGRGGAKESTEIPNLPITCRGRGGGAKLRER